MDEADATAHAPAVKQNLDDIRRSVAGILAGWTPLPTLGGEFVKEDGAGYIVAGRFGRESHVKITWGADDSPDTPDDPIEAAHWLVARFGSDTVSREVSQLELGAELLADAGDEEQGDLTDAEARQLYRGNEPDDPQPEENAESAYSSPEPPPLQAELAPEPEAFAGTTILGADPLDRIRSQRIGDVARIAAGKIAERRAAASYTLAEYQELQGYVMSHTDAVGAFKGDDERYQRFVALADCQRAVNDLGAYRDGLTEALLEASREAVEAFDPAAGWPS